MISLLAAIMISATVDSTQIQLGDQTQMTVEVTQQVSDMGTPLDFVAQLPEGVESIDKKPVSDTVQINEDQFKVIQHLTLTGWGDTTYTIQPYVVANNGDTVFANGMPLTVRLPEGMEDMKAVIDIKPIEEVPIWWWDIVKWIVLGIGIALFLVGGYYVERWYKLHYGNKKAVQIAPKYTRPAEVDALEALDAIKAAHIWQQGKNKEYHTDLTDVVRTYIGRRFDVHSTEKTSDETLQAMKPLIAKELHVRLSEMLQLADFVKFAKYQPLPEENEKALDIAYAFVHETTPVVEEKSEKVKG